MHILPFLLHGATLRSKFIPFFQTCKFPNYFISRKMAGKNDTVTFELKDETITIDGYRVNYTVVGNGNINMLLLPGAMGTMQSDFEPQLRALSKEKYTIVSWDPIGYGKSRPPEREFISDFYVHDAKIVSKLMTELGREEFSVVGWSDGAITGLIMAALFPFRVRHLVALAPMAYVTDQDVEIYNALKDISKWTPALKQKLEAVYGAKQLEILWTTYCEYFQELHNRGGDICRRFLSDVRCPTLVMHGCLDPVVPVHHGQFVADNVNGARLQLFEKGKHNFHYRFADEVNSAIDEFVSKF